MQHKYLYGNLNKKNIMKEILFLAITFSTMSCNFMSGQNSSIENQNIQNQRLKLKNLAFCQCQSRVDSNVLAINDASAAGFKAYLAYKEEVMVDLREFTKKWVTENEKKYKSYSDSPLTNMKCLDYYNSKELKDYILKQDNKIDKAILKKMSE